MRSALLAVDGVKTVEVLFEAKEAKVSYDPRKASVKDLVAAVKKAGFGCSEKKGEKKDS